MKNLKLKPILYLILFTLTLPQSLLNAEGKNDLFYTTLPGSKLWIEGTSTIKDYTCNTGIVNGYAEISNLSDIKSGIIHKDKAQISITVRALDCGNNTMNSDMYNAMKVNEFPEIKYELVNARIISKPDSNMQFTLNTSGYLSVAGKRKLENVKVTVEKLSDDLFRIKGSLPISMLDFGISPPEHLLGLIKAHDKLVVYFDIIVSEGKVNQ
jgi:hypothetical protein